MNAREAPGFTRAEVAAYYSTRFPTLKQAGTEWRGPCPLHNGKRDSFAVEPGTGLWHCHSECGRGGDILALEAAFTGAAFKKAKSEVVRIVGRAGSTNGDHGLTARIVATYDYTDEIGRLLYQAGRM